MFLHILLAEAWRISTHIPSAEWEEFLVESADEHWLTVFSVFNGWQSARWFHDYFCSLQFAGSDSSQHAARWTHDSTVQHLFGRDVNRRWWWKLNFCLWRCPLLPQSWRGCMGDHSSENFVFASLFTIFEYCFELFFSMESGSEAFSGGYSWPDAIVASRRAHCNFSSTAEQNMDAVTAELCVNSFTSMHQLVRRVFNVYSVSVYMSQFFV